MMDSADFEKAFLYWFHACRDLYESDGRKDLGYTLYWKDGRKYRKVIANTGNQRSVWAFIDKTNADILKPASWHTPAKGYRGNLYDPDSGLRYISWTGPMYMSGIQTKDKEDTQ
tara:strand:+ start:584 stop:925 length:342 start_codon:yes stop_codon:yes gene_type:complete